MMIQLKLYTLGVGSFAVLGTVECANEAVALDVATKHALGAGYSNVKTVYDGDGSVRFTARTPRGPRWSQRRSIRLVLNSPGGPPMLTRCVFLCLFLQLTGCATLQRHPVATAVAVAIVAGSIAASTQHDNRDSPTVASVHFRCSHGAC
jgi:hypothetical protein